MRAVAAKAFESGVNEVVATPPEALATIARRMIAARRALDGCLPATFIPDPSIDMLMALYLARGERRVLTMQELEARTTVAPTVAQRWMAALAVEGFVVLDAGTATLSEPGVANVEAALNAVIASQQAIA